MAEFIEVENETKKPKSEASKKTAKPPPKRRGKTFNIPCPAHSEARATIALNRPEISRCSVDGEVKGGLKETVITAMSSTFPDKQRRETLKEKLKSSQCINKYIDNRISDNFLNVLNDHLKFGVVYAYNWFDTYQSGGMAPVQTQAPNQNIPPKM